MTGAKHTPAPWHFLEAHDHDHEFNSSRPLTICSEGNDDLANVYSGADSTVLIPREQAVANAHLIAAAPEMYAAIVANREATRLLCEWLSTFTDDVPRNVGKAWANAGKLTVAAIAKAEGGAS